MKTTAFKSTALKVLTAATLAGALLTAAAPAAQAQEWRVGVRFGGPVYVPAPPVVVYRPGWGYGYYDRDHRFFARDDRRFYDRDDHRRFDHDDHFRGDRDHDRR